MSVRGPKPADDRTQVRHRNPETYEWLEVLNVPYEGPSPDLPDTHEVTSRGGNRYEVTISDLTREWWQAVRHMPHCVHWTDTDWQFARSTAFVADEAFAGNIGAAAELRQREKILGTTMDARRDLRIRYVSELTQSPETTTESNGQVVKPLNDRRKRLSAVV